MFERYPLVDQIHSEWSAVDIFALDIWRRVLKLTLRDRVTPGASSVNYIKDAAYWFFSRFLGAFEELNLPTEVQRWQVQSIFPLWYVHSFVWWN